MSLKLVWRESPQLLAMTSSNGFFFFLFFFFFQLPVTDPTQFAEHLFLKHEKFEKLLFPDGVDETFGVEPKGVEQSLSQS